MPSLVTGVISGIQGASASHNAANYLMTGYGQAGKTVTDAVNQVNPNILNAANTAATGVTNAANTAGTGAVNAATTAGTGATTAAAAAGTGAVNAAQTAGQGATDAAGNLVSMLSPYTQGGSAAMGQLSAGLAPGGALSTPFTASMMAQYSPAYQFQLSQGQQAAARAAAAGGGASGGVAKAMNRYAQDYANTAFGSAANLYNTQQQNTYNRLAGVAGMGQQAATVGGQAQQQAAEYGGTLGTQAAQYAGTMGTEAAQYAGNLGTQAAQYAGNMGYNAGVYGGNAGINATNLTSQNTLSAANYLANTQIQSAAAHAQGDLGAAGQWNNMLGSIGQTGDMIAFGGLDSGGGGGWSLGNLGQNIWGNRGGGGFAMNTPIGGGIGLNQTMDTTSPYYQSGFGYGGE